MIKVSIPHKIYSVNKVKIKNIIKKYGMSWDSSKNGWVNAASGDGVYIDRAIMDMILSDSFSGDMPMAMFVDSKNKEFISELETKVREIGGELSEQPGTAEKAYEEAKPFAVIEKKPKLKGKETVFTRLNIRDSEGNTTEEFSLQANADLKAISKRWERRKKQIMYEYRRLGMDESAIEGFLHREEIAFRKNNACWVTGEFPSAEHVDSTDEKGT